MVPYHIIGMTALVLEVDCSTWKDPDLNIEVIEEQHSRFLFALEGPHSHNW